MPRLGKLRLDEVTYAVIEDFKLALAQTPINTGKTYDGVKLDPKSKKTLSAKTINNVLTVLRRMLVVARKRGLIESVPDVEWLKSERPEFDFLDFNEAERLLKAAHGEWRTMILTALRTGMRHGELIGLRWEDVNLVAGRITVRQNVVYGKIGTPKSGKPREIPLGVEVRTRHERRVARNGRHSSSALARVQEGGASADRLPCPSPQLRLTPRDASRARACRSCSGTRRSR